jgi:hypothetical protein
LIEQYDPKIVPSPVPELPAQGPGPQYSTSEDGPIDRVAASDIDAAGNDTRTINQLTPLVQRCIDELLGHLSRNQFPELRTTVERYAAALNPSPGYSIEWAEVWGLGVMLQNAASSAERKIEARLLPAMEDPAKTSLDSLLTLHGPLILATGDGAKLSATAQNFMMTREQQVALRAAAELVAEQLKSHREVITARAAESVVDAVHVIGEGTHPERGSVYGIATIKNLSVILIGGAAIATPAIIGALLGSAVLGAVAGSSVKSCVC